MLWQNDLMRRAFVAKRPLSGTFKASAPRTYAGTSVGPCVGFANGCNADAPEMLTGMWTRAVRLTEYTTKQRKLKSSKSWLSAKNL